MDLSKLIKFRADVSKEINIMEVRDLEYNIGHKKILDNISFNIKEGDFMAILGPNGAGKTTLVQVLAGLLSKYKGNITFQNINLKNIKRKNLWHKLGLVFQNPEWQFTSYKVEDELLYSLKRFKLTKEQKNEKISFFLKKFNLENNLHDNPYLLSQGQKRRLSVATMLIAGQIVLILDEPTYGQDQESLDNLLDYMKHLNEQEGITVIIITHDMEIVGEYCNRAIVLNEGRKIFEGVVEELYNDSDILLEGKLAKPFWKEINERLKYNGI